MFKFDEPYGTSIFCDDVRAEVGGKASFMGVYNGVMLVPHFPIVLPKFAIVVLFREPREWAKKRKFDVVIKIFIPGQEEPIITNALSPIPEEAIETVTQSTLGDEPDVPQLLLAQAALILAPFALNEAGRIRVRADYGDEILKMGSLRVEQASVQGAAA